MGFTDQIATHGVYLTELAEYLEARGLSIDDLPCVPYHAVDHGYVVLRDKVPTPYPLTGWAFQVRGPSGDLEPAYLLRPQNWPEEELFQIKRQKDETTKLEPAKIVKFKQCSPRGHEFIHWASPLSDLIHAPVIMVHEKFTSATLAVKLLGIPSLALSGCWNWSKGQGVPKDSILNLVTKLQRGTKIVVCFDGDMLSNPMIMDSASHLKGWINSNRPDLQVVFPPLPDKLGWDDYAVQHGPAAWLALLDEEGVDITHLLPVEYLMGEFGVSLCARGKDKLMVEHSIDNYARLLDHPSWADYVADSLGGALYHREIIGGPLGLDDFVVAYLRWLEQHVWRSMGKGPEKGKVRDAVRMVMAERTVSMPIHLLERQPEVSEAAAASAAHRLITDGLRVTGPMTREETVETLLRMCRDLVALWSDDVTVDVQWALALVGPTGCGKSNFPKSLTACFYDWGYQPKVAQFMKDGPKASLDELLRVARDAMMGVFDEYNPDERSARIVEQNLFTLSTTRSSDQRRLYQEQSSRLIRHAAVMLTTTDKNRNYMRSGKDTGERRFITLEVEGVKPHGGRMSSDREVIKGCGAVLLRYGLQLWQRGSSAPSTEYSEATTAQFLGDGAGILKLAAYWTSLDLRGALENFIKDQTFGEKTVRFSWPQLYQRLAAGVNLTRFDRDDLRNLCLEAGMVEVGKARVKVCGKVVQKDKAYELPEPVKWLDALCARL